MTKPDHLTATDFMMMDVHRPMTDEDINETNSQARLDKSARTTEDEQRDASGVGSAPEKKLRVIDPLPDNVVIADVATSHHLQVQRVLQAAHDRGLDDVMVVGWHDDGEIYFLASDPSIGNAVYRLELAKQKLLSAVKDRWNMDVPETRDYEPDEPA